MKILIKNDIYYYLQLVADPRDAWEHKYHVMRYNI